MRGYQRRILELSLILAALIGPGMTAKAQDASDKIVKIETETCLDMKPQTSFAFEENNYCEDKDSNGNCENWSTYYTFDYFYRQRTTVLVLMPDGKGGIARTQVYKYENMTENMLTKDNGDTGKEEALQDIEDFKAKNSGVLCKAD